MEEELQFEDIFELLIEEVKEIEIVYDYVIKYYKDDSYATYEIKKINGEYPYSFNSKIKKLGKEGLTTIKEKLNYVDYEDRTYYLQELKEELLGLKYGVEDKVIVYDESEYGPREELTFKSFKKTKLIPFNEERQNGHDKSILRKASEFVEVYLDTIDNVANKIEFLINQIELLPEPKNVIKDKNTIQIFYSWQSDKDVSRRIIWKALNSVEKDLKKEGKK